MRPTYTATALAAIALYVAGCGDDDSTRLDAAVDARATVDAPAELDAPAAIDAPSIDAPSDAGPVNALGQLCGPTEPECPLGNECAIPTGGSATMGYCSPSCMNMSSICTTGYTGPAGGMPICVLTVEPGGDPDLCAIVCGATEDCPTGLTCVMVSGGSLCMVAP